MGGCLSTPLTLTLFHDMPSRAREEEEEEEEEGEGGSWGPGGYWHRRCRAGGAGKAVVGSGLCLGLRLITYLPSSPYLTLLYLTTHGKGSWKGAEGRSWKGRHGTGDVRA